MKSWTTDDGIESKLQAVVDLGFAHIYKSEASEYHFYQKDDHNRKYFCSITVDILQEVNIDDFLFVLVDACENC